VPRYKFIAYDTAPTPRYIVVWDIHWHIIDCQRIESHADLSAAMTTALQRLEAQGWIAEGETPYGFVFIRRENERRMLMLTPRDPLDSSRQSFNPFKE
jgi:hypothetical protein